MATLEFPAEGASFRGPLAVSTISMAGRSLKLVRPADPDLLLDDPDVRARNDRDGYMPYWAYLWTASTMLAEAVAAHWGAAGSPPLEILELGCGLGLGGLTAMSLGYRVCFSDYDASALELVGRSVRENGLPLDRFSTLAIDWRDPPDLRFDRIIAADVLYEARLVPMLADVLARMLAPGGEALIATPPRSSAGDFPKAVARVGLSLKAEPATALDETGAPQRGTIFRVGRSARPASCSRGL